MRKRRYRTLVGKAGRKTLLLGLLVTCPIWLRPVLSVIIKMLTLPLLIFQDCFSTGGLAIRMAVLTTAAIFIQALALRWVEGDVRWRGVLTLCGTGTILGLLFDVDRLFAPAENIADVRFDSAWSIFKILLPIFLANSVVFAIFGGVLAHGEQGTNGGRPGSDSAGAEEDPGPPIASQSDVDAFSTAPGSKVAGGIVTGPPRALVVKGTGYLGACLASQSDVDAFSTAPGSKVAGEIVIAPVRSLVVTGAGYLGACLGALALFLASWFVSACFGAFVVWGPQTPSLLREVSGCIYYTPDTDSGRNDKIIQWDVRSSRVSLEIHFPRRELVAWDVEGNLLAYAQKTGPARAVLRIARLPARAGLFPRRQFPTPEKAPKFTPEDSKVLLRAEMFEFLDISPNKKRIAAIISHVKNNGNGDSCRSDFRLVLLNLETGERDILPADAPQPFPYGGACWLPDSRRIVYCGDNAALHVPPEPVLERLKWVLQAPPYGGCFAPVLYLFDPESGSVQRLGLGAWPTLCTARRTIIARVSIFDDDAYILFYSLDDRTGAVRARRFPFAGFDTVQASPDGRVLSGFPKVPVFLAAGKHSCALLDWEHPIRRHVFLPDTIRQFTTRVWTTRP